MGASFGGVSSFFSLFSWYFYMASIEQRRASTVPNASGSDSHDTGRGHGALQTCRDDYALAVDIIKNLEGRNSFLTIAVGILLAIVVLQWCLKIFKYYIRCRQQTAASKKQQ
jgi:hypothetical protein